MEDLLQLQLLARQQRTPYVVATIVEATGSTPRTEGKMLVYADGRSAGTIGGGLAELRAKKDAADAIRCGKNRLVRYEVVPQAAASGMACGGALQVFIEVYGTRPLLVVCGHSHTQDGEALHAALGKDAAYVGMLGSRRKIAALFERLRSLGVPQAQLDTVCTPIGFDLGGETPEELAIAILAQILLVKNRGRQALTDAKEDKA